MMNCATPTNKINTDPYNIKQELLEAPRPRPDKRSNIVEFYANRSVLITGASGFIGKVLIEKLIRSCPTIRRIFVLIRPKWNKKPEDRLRELLEAPLFDGLPDSKLQERVVLVEGDVTQPNLGLNGKNLSRILKEVSVIFHSAATVKFDEPLKLSVAINIAGTKNIIEVCRRIPQLASLVHVSTAYANCDQMEIDEHIYPLDMDPEKLIQMAYWLDQDTLQELKRRLLAARPNTYTYTKALAEWLLIRTARDLPVVVCRPSIVIASAQEPIKGWIDNVNGPTGVILGAGKGLIRSMYAETKLIADLVPVDMVINLVVALGWFAYVNKGQKRLNDAAESFSESILSARSTSPSASGCSNSSTASISGDDSYDLESHQHDSLTTTNEVNEQQNGDKVKVLLEQQQTDLPSIIKQTEIVVINDNRQVDSLSHLDDGYGSSRNSIASSDTASTSSSVSSVIRKGHHHHRRRQTRPSIKETCTAIVEQRQQQSDTLEQEEPRDQMEIIDSNVKLVNNKYEPDEELQCKLRQFRQKSRTKVAEQGLPIELADVPVFHCTSGSENPITWGRVQVLILAALSMYPSSTTYRYPNASFTNNKILDDFYRWTLHYLPGYIADFVTKLCGGKPIIVRIFNKFDQAAGVLRAFTSKQWHFKYDNRLFLFEQLMNDEDRRLFNFDMRSFDWKELLQDYVLGVRKFMLKEPIDNLEQARSNLKTIYYRNLSLHVLFMASFVYYTVSSVSGLLY